MKKPLQTQLRTQLLTVLLASLLLLCACTGGTGSGDGKSVLGTNLDDPFSSDTPLFYISRPIPVADDDLLNPYAINQGAHLYMRSNAALSGSEVNISGRIYGNNALYDVKDLDVSRDGSRIVFAMHAPEADVDDPAFTWNIWEYNITTDQLRRLITDNFAAEEGDDVQPRYLPDNRIVFSSTRQSTNRGILLDEGKPQYSGQHEDRNDEHASVLHIIDDAGDFEQVSFNQSHDFDPVVMDSGEILYSRWDNIAATDQVSLYKVTPGGGELSLSYGFHSQDDIAQGGPGYIDKKRLMPDGRLLAILRERTTNGATLGGDIVTVDIDNFIDLNQPTAANTGLMTSAISSLSVQNVEIENDKSPGGRFFTAWPLNDGSNRLLVSWSQCRALDAGLTRPCRISPAAAPAAAPLFGIWTYDLDSNTQQPLILGQEGRMISDILVAEPPVNKALLFDNIDLALETEQQAVLNIRSIYDIDGVDTAAGGILANADPAVTDPETITEKFLRLEKAVSIPDDDTLDFDNSAFGVNASQGMREILGYVPIEPDGSVRTRVPANVPFMISVVDRLGRRLHPRHENWIHLAPGATLNCRSCHGNNSIEPHGRLDAQPASVHPGAPAGSLVPYANTETLNFVSNGGETMAELFAADNLIPARSPSVNLVYNDDWTDDTQPMLSKAMAFSVEYANLNTAAPVSAACEVAWNESCRTVINYPDHIQPLWELPRTPIDDGSGMGVMVDRCTGCHTTAAGTRVPAAQLDLTATASDIDPDHFTSYRDLLRADGEQALNGGATSERSWQCTVLDAMNMPIQVIQAPPQIPRSLTEAGALSFPSTEFFNCMTQDNSCDDNIGAALPGNCIEIGGAPVTMEPVINHNGLLSDEELRLIAEWLDIGAQYYNNPFDAP